MKTAYISYSRRDRIIANKVASVLPQYGYRAFIDIDELSGGSTFAEQLIKRLNASDIVIYIVSEASLNSQWCRREIDYAANKGKTIIPIAVSQDALDEALYKSSIISSLPALVWNLDGEYILSTLLQRQFDKNHSQDIDPSPSIAPSPSRGRDRRYGQIVPHIGLLNKKSSNLGWSSIFILAAALGAFFFFFKESGSSYYTWLLIIMIIAVIAIGGWWLPKRKIRIKLVSNKDCVVYVDNKKVASLAAKNVTFIKLLKGEYYMVFKPFDNSIKDKNISIRINTKNELISVDFPEKKVIKCFIAGSTKLEAERNALRSGIAQTHNAWRGKNFEILSYTYEDFERKVVDGGHQSKYDEFIEKEATIAVFIISGEIGEFTITEFEKAMNAFKNGKHPQILVFNDINAPAHEQSDKLKAMVSAQKQYWANYDSINALKLQFMHTLDWMLIDMFYK